MNKVVNKFSQWILALILLAMVLVITGCADTEPDNRSARPWNAPKNWEGGLPMGLTEGR